MPPAFLLMRWETLRICAKWKLRNCATSGCGGCGRMWRHAARLATMAFLPCRQTNIESDKAIPTEGCDDMTEKYAGLYGRDDFSDEDIDKYFDFDLLGDAVLQEELMGLGCGGYIDETATFIDFENIPVLSAREVSSKIGGWSELTPSAAIEAFAEAGIYLDTDSESFSENFDQVACVANIILAAKGPEYYPVWAYFEAHGYDFIFPPVTFSEVAAVFEQASCIDYHELPDGVDPVEAVGRAYAETYGISDFEMEDCFDFEAYAMAHEQSLTHERSGDLDAMLEDAQAASLVENVPAAVDAHVPAER